VRSLKKVGRILALLAMMAIGVVASLFIKGCASKNERPGPSQPQSDGTSQSERQPEPKTKPRVDRKEVEEGQPLPRNYVE
jgi:hypothetical protein